MTSSLGIYIEKNIIKYAKVIKKGHKFTIDIYDVKFYDDLQEILQEIIEETDNYDLPISINISSEMYNYFKVFSTLDDDDQEAMLNIQFEKLCEKKKLDKNQYESRYQIQYDTIIDEDKFNAVYVTVSKEELNNMLEFFKGYKLSTLAPEAMSIINLVDLTDIRDDDITLIVNLEEKTEISLYIGLDLLKIDFLDTGLGKAIDLINKNEMNYKKSYEKLKNINLYNQGVKSLNQDDNEYIDVVLPIMQKIVDEIKKLIEKSKLNVSKIYITGLGATMNNVDLYFNENFDGINSEILKPFFIDASSLKNSIKDYIEVNSAIAIALNGMGKEFCDETLNFAPTMNKIDVSNIKNVKSEIQDADWKEEIINNPITSADKLLIRAILTVFMMLIIFCTFSNKIGYNLKEKNNSLVKALENSSEQLARMNNERTLIEKYTEFYQTLINGGDASNVLNSESQRVIIKDGIPNMLNEIMFAIPKDIQITKIENTNDNNIVINANSENKDSFDKFLNSLKDGILKNVKTSSITQNGSIYEITIEGEI